VITNPDFLFTANDQTDVPGNPTLGYNIASRGFTYDQANVLPGLHGPGLINTPTAISFNKVGDLFINGPIINLGVLNTNTLLQLSELNQIQLLAWGSFDASTNDPIVYPNGTDIQNLVNQILIQISPASLPAGTSGTAYPATTFTTTGGAFSAPYNWSLASGSGALPPGLSLSSGGTISGTPTQAGTYDFIIQLTDSLARSVTWNYSITIQ
jgi:hypothetical protein